MEIYEIVALVITAVLGAGATFFADQFANIKKISKLKSEILEDKGMSKEQAEQLLDKVKKVFNSD